MNRYDIINDNHNTCSWREALSKQEHIMESEDFKEIFESKKGAIQSQRG